MKYNAIFELMEMLKNADIPFESKEHFDGYCVYYPRYGRMNYGCKCSVAEHEYTYGHEEDKLEIMGLLTEEEANADTGGSFAVAGYLTATDVFNRIKNDYKERQSDGKKR